MHPLITFLIATAALTSCKAQKETKSQPKTLDNFAKHGNEDLTLNVCGIEFNGNLESLPEPVKNVEASVVSSDPKVKQLALGVLTSVPGVLLDLFFKSGGKLILTEDASNICKDTPFTAAEKELASEDGVVASCWKQDQPGMAPNMYLSLNGDLVHHSIVRLFGYMYTEFFVARISDPQAPESMRTETWQSATKAFLDIRSELARAFLADLKEGNFSTYQSLNDFHTRDASKFENYVFAEALDSYYCSDDTRNSFKSKFAKTFKVFTNSDNPNAPSTQFGNMDEED